MVHFLSHQRRSEFLSASGIARFEMCLTGVNSRPTLYIKSNIIDLYFVTKNSFLTLELIDVDDDLLVYVIGVDEGEEAPMFLYSSIETLSEKRAVEMIASGSNLDVILFNDFAIEIARTTGAYDGSSFNIERLSEFSPVGPDRSGKNSDRVSKAVSEYANGIGARSSPRILLSEFTSETTSHIASGEGSLMKISGFESATEVHEMLPQIVGDHTSLRFEHSPDVERSEGKKRELCDAIIIGDRTLLSLQAKCFDFEGEIPPTKRSNSEKRMRKNVKKAIAQTKGSSRMIRKGKTISAKGKTIIIPKHTRITFAIFIPSLDLISRELGSELAELGKYLDDFGQSLVVLDPMQFLRTLQAAENAYISLGSTIDDAFFQLLEKNSRSSLLCEKDYATPILYRW